MVRPHPSLVISVIIGAIILFAIMAGGHALGFIGVLLAVPLAAVTGVLAHEAFAYYRLTAYYRCETYQDKI
ncbi:MAG: hypothetical protein WCF85_10490 [Rhodospirillaceae bacterium]